MSALQDSLIELIRRTSAEIPDDVQRAILDSLEREKKGTIAESALKIIERNIALAKQKSQPICQDTGSILFYVDCPVGVDQIAFEDAACPAVKKATKLGYLRQNSVDSLTGINDGTNVGPGSPTFHFHQHRSDEISVRLVLKGGGCENVGAQYSLPNEKLNANRDLGGCRKVILTASRITFRQPPRSRFAFNFSFGNEYCAPTFSQPPPLSTSRTLISSGRCWWKW